MFESTKMQTKLRTLLFLAIGKVGFYDLFNPSLPL